MADAPALFLLLGYIRSYLGAGDTPPSAPHKKRRRYKMFRGVNLKAWVALLVAGMAAAIVVVLLVDGTKPARAGAFPGTNGKIAFDTDRDGGNSEIYAMNPDGNQQTNLSRSVADISASYSANGKKIAFSSVRDGNSEIYSMNANGTLQ